MRNIIFAFALLVVGFATGYFARGIFQEERTQRKLASMSGETLSRLDDLGRFTRGFEPNDINRKWDEYIAASKSYSDRVALRDAWTTWESAIVFKEVEKVGWKEYRGVIVHACAKYLKVRPLAGQKMSEFATGEENETVKMIHEAIPEELLAKEATFY
ncbi:hypothetical protein DB347_24410 [Opitutaceae bacterium EW11]|nr:hypothetical protein DB347_24410 [Opitutaceae bacterium EW11]